MRQVPKIKGSGLPVSVVIATLGGPTLSATIGQLNQQPASAPAEILVCIPEQDVANANSLKEVPNVHIINTPCRGQVAQRAFGLRMASQPYVMQLDDDVILPKGALDNLLTTLMAKGAGNAIAPFFRIKDSGMDGTVYPDNLSGLLRSCHASLVCGAPFGKKRSGRISPAGIGFGIAPTDTYESIESDWLPGGAILCHAEDQIDRDYYPFSGKAFSEDLIHSILWRTKGVRLWTQLGVCAFVEVTKESLEWPILIARFRAHEYVAKMINGSAWRTKFWFACYCLVNLPGLLATNLSRLFRL